MSSAASIESVCLNWMLSLVCFVLFALIFLFGVKSCKTNIIEKKVAKGSRGMVAGLPSL